MMKDIFKISGVSVLLTICLTCSEREKENPFDPSGAAPVSLSVLSYGTRVDLSWGEPRVTNYTGFNLYKRDPDEETEYTMLARDLLPSTRSFIDTYVEFEHTYQYRLTVIGQGMESQPSNTVTIKPGPGINWIVDRLGYQLLRTTYDCQHIIRKIETNYAPYDMAFSNGLGRGVVLYLYSGLVEVKDRFGQNQAFFDEIRYPISVAYDAVDSLFWIADSSGSLYTLDTRSEQIDLVSNALGHPIHLNINPEENLIHVIDRGNKEIVQYNRSGDVVNRISRAADKPLQGPYRYRLDPALNREWLIDGNGTADFIYTKLLSDDIFTRIDSVTLAGDLEIDLINGMAWYVLFNTQRSLVVQLSPDGSRQTDLPDYFYNPYDIKINPYDGTILVVDTGNGRVMHYNRELEVIGMTSHLNFPVKVVVE